jgi:hypothetical protein
MSMYTQIVHKMATVVGQKKWKIGTAVNFAYQGKFSACHFGHACHRFAIPLLVQSVINQLHAKLLGRQ